MNIIKQMRVIGKPEEGPVGSSMDSHDSVAHSTYCPPCSLHWDWRTLSLLLSLFAMQSRWGRWQLCVYSVQTQHSHQHPMIETETVSEMLVTSSSLTQLIVRKDFIVLVLTLKDTENTLISQNKIRNLAWIIIYNCQNILSLIMLCHCNWEGE
jgi:hypothetical protein